MLQVAETIFSKGLDKNVCNMFGIIYWGHDICSVTNKTSKVMIIDGKMIFPWSKLWAIHISDIDFIILPESETKKMDILSLVQINLHDADSRP